MKENKGWSPGSSLKMALTVVIAIAVYTGLAFISKSEAQEVPSEPQVVVAVEAPEVASKSVSLEENKPLGKQENVAPAASEEVSEVSSHVISCLFNYDWRDADSWRVKTAAKLLKSYGCEVTKWGTDGKGNSLADQFWCLKDGNIKDECK